MNIEKTSITPEVKFADGILEISGRSVPKHGISFYAPIKEAIEKYCLAPSLLTTVKITLEYFNTTSSKALLDIFKIFERLKKAGHDVRIEWYYEEDDQEMLEYGEDYQAIINVPF